VEDEISVVGEILDSDLGVPALADPDIPASRLEARRLARFDGAGSA